MKTSPFGWSQKELKSRIIQSSYSILRRLGYSKWVNKTHKFLSGTNYFTEVFIEFPIKNEAFGVTAEYVDKGKYIFHYIIQSEYTSKEDLEETLVDYELIFIVEYKSGSEFEKIIYSGGIEL